MRKPLLIAVGTLVLLGSASAPAQQSASTPLTGVRPQNGPKRQGQPQTPSSSDLRLRAPATKIKLGPPKSGPKVLNPHAALRDAAVIAVLQKQRQAADLEAAQMKIGIRPVVQSQPKLQPQMQPQSPPMSAPVANSPNKTKAPAPANIQKAPATGTIAPGKTSDAQGNTPSLYAQARQFDTTLVTCGHDPAMRILKVSGDAAPATFTPIDKYNLYTISGCSFGNSNANNKVSLYGKGSFQGTFLIRFWSENAITIALDPALSGVLDQDNLTLVVQRADGTQVNRNGFKFYAARGDAYGNPIPLKQVSQGQAKLWPSDLFVTKYSSPADIAQGISAQVSRDLDAHFDKFRTVVYFNTDNKEVPLGDPRLKGLDAGWYPRNDKFDLSNLAPSFESVSFDYFYWTPNPRDLCGAWDETDHKTNIFGTWDFEWSDSNHITVSVQSAACWDHEQSGRDNWAQESQYALRVWVLGPRCIDPWTGQPDPACISEVRKQVGQ
jgi:hypothetical protein